MKRQARALETTEPERHAPNNGNDHQRAAVQRSVETMGIDLSPYAFEIVVARVTTLTERTGPIGDAQVRSIVNDVVSSTEILQGVAESFR